MNVEMLSSTWLSSLSISSRRSSMNLAVLSAISLFSSSHRSLYTFMIVLSTFSALSGDTSWYFRLMMVDCSSSRLTLSAPCRDCAARFALSLSVMLSRRQATSVSRANDLYCLSTLGTLVCCSTRAMLLKSLPLADCATVPRLVSNFTITAASRVYTSAVVER